MAIVLDSSSPDLAVALNVKSKHLQNAKKFSSKETASVIAATGISDRTLDQLRTACNNTLGSNPFASKNKVAKIREEMLPINRQDWQATYHYLYKNKQGKNVHKQ